ncbi:neurexin-4 isoform X1 [Agrilus planipennis]|uniref:Neurexin-4 isoform X1 n=1 Tax=Agrilus planipennis TaxID=224129 RepID=A0A1W4W2V1_AGRPL|nr:neurexin-4 isoform X1 [Agrilus planipennis]
MIKWLLVLCTFYTTSRADLYDYYDCNNPLMQRAAVNATSWMRDRGPRNAILYGGNAWTAQSSDFDQQLIIDLGHVMNVTRIWTQGRPHSSEYVMEYSISYGFNGFDYTDYKESGGDTRMFKGNSDGDSIYKNEFEVPIIAQWIRINPTRWRDRISMRVELFGCEYKSDVLNFNGSSLLAQDLLRDPIAASRETIRLRFKTSSANGVLMYSRGTQGDYIALQLKENRMLLNIDLGSGIVTSLSVGSLLDDNIWHDVVISRNRRDILFSVDRVVVHSRIKGEFSRLNLNRALFFGGVPYIQEGLVITQNFTGCLENIYLNSSNLIQEVKEAFDYGLSLRFTKINTNYTCVDVPLVAVTFLTANSFAKLKGYEGISSMNASFSFRTFEENALMLYHSFSSPGHVAIFLEFGKIKVELVTGDSPKVVLDNFDGTFNDGRWHTIVLTISTNSLVLSVDYRPMRTVRHIKIVTGGLYLIAGGVTGQIGTNYVQIPGFVGCMRTISIDGNNKLPTDWTNEEYCCKGEVAFDTCRMTDKCNPNPCEHGGVCKQNSMEFLCDCAGTGYGGAVCHTTLNPLSCQGYKNVHSVNQKANIKIDVDGSGPLAPFPVTCEFYADGRVITMVQHSNQQTTPVDGFQEPGSYKQNIIYEASDDQIRALVNRSATCRQRIQYSCRASRLFNSPSDEASFRPFSWWVSSNNQNMDYWGGALPGSRKCECGILGNCLDSTKWCNCDAGLEQWAEDTGDITEKEHLPVKQIRIGDTGNALDEKEGRYTLGPLICEGDDLFDNVITFRISDATINLPPFDMGHSGDIYLEFKTTIENAVILHAKGRTDFIKLSIVGGDLLQFQYQAGLGPITINYKTSYKLADDRWHLVAIERNRKGARLVVDGALKSEVREPPGPIRALHLTSPLVVGATVDYRDGFTGCIRSLLLNGNLVDLRSYARRNLYGISEGCVGKCQSNPCLNNGTCHEKYDGYWCDCRWTAFKGPICADEIGVNMRQSSLVKYDFMGSWRSTISEKIRVGWTTTNPKGFLLGFFSNISGEYMTISVSNSGSLKVVFDFGFERQEVIYPNKHFGLGQYHDLRLSRKDSGATMVMQVDDYEPREFKFNIKVSADAQFNNIQYMYIGRNESMAEGFTGCISRVEFDDIYPLKLLFQQKGPGNVKSLGTPLTEDFCGVEPITHPPDIIETRPSPELDEEKVREAYNETDSAVLGSVLAVVIIGIIILAILIGRYLHRHKGEYLTQEDVGAESALDPDTAVVQGTTGHQVQKKKEWFI